MSVPHLNKDQLQKLRKMKQEALGSMLREDAEKDLRKEIAERANQELNMEKKTFNKLVRLDYKDQMEEVSNEIRELEELLEQLNNPSVISGGDSEDGEEGGV